MILVAGSVTADDRQLLRAEGAPANVLVIIDSGASMTHDPLSNTVNFLGAGDDTGMYTDQLINEYTIGVLKSRLGMTTDTEVRAHLNRGSKLHQAKSALYSFFHAGFEFNFGFSFYEKTDISVHHVNYIYKVKEYDSAGDAQGSMLDGTAVGEAIRMGSVEDVRNTHAAAPYYPVRFGINGDETTYWYHPANVGPDDKGDYANGDIRIVSYLVDASGTALSALSLDERIAANMFYYPAYRWGACDKTNETISCGNWVRNGLKGLNTWEEVATHNKIKTSDPTWKKTVHDYVLEDIKYVGDPWSPAVGLGKLVTSNQIGSQTLYIYEEWQVYRNDNKSWIIDSNKTETTEVEWVQQFVLYDHDIAETNPGAATLSAVDYQGTADCAGYVDGTDNTPVVPIYPPDSVTGKIKDQTWLIDSYLQEQTSAVFYFPDYDPTNGVYYLPDTRSKFVPLTESIIAIGRRPIKDSINEASGYFTKVIDNWSDPLSNCRMNFIILITDGFETCSNLTAPCSAAANIDKISVYGHDGVPVYVIYFGSESNADLSQLGAGESVATVINCVATESGGAALAAGDEDELRRALIAIAMDIEERTRGFASPIVPSVETTTKQTAYISTFTPRQDRSIWRGHLRSYPIDPSTGLIANLRADGTPNPLESSWDAGDLLSSREASDRMIYYGVNAATDNLPGTRETFVYPYGTAAADFDKREYLGTNILSVGSWYDGSGVEDPAMLADLRDTIFFIRGEIMERDDTGAITKYGRDPDLYGWCGATTDYDESLNIHEPCELPDADLIGVEKLGDIFHSTPQLLGAPSCFTCWHHDYWDYRTFRDVHRYRRQILFSGSNNGMFHAFDAGLWDSDGANIEGTDYPPRFDSGTGREVFGWIPQAVLDSLDYLAFSPDHRWTVDSTATVADVYVDRVFTSGPVASDREWRSVVIMGQRRGGRSYVCLDITRPDPYDNSTGLPSIAGDLAVKPWKEAFKTDRDPVCADGTATDCDGIWPEFRWEFKDEAGDDDGNLEADLGQTWSRPVVGFVKIDEDNNSVTDPEARMVAVFGGGYSPEGLAPALLTGNFVYMVDIETGEVLHKEESIGMVPGDIAALDLNLDGYLESLYWGDTAGRIYKMDISTEGLLDTDDRITNWSRKIIFDATPADGSLTQPFFMRPTLVPLAFNADASAVIGIAIGAGNRDDIFEANFVPHRFYIIADKDTASGDPIKETDLQHITLDSASTATGSFFEGDTGFGWFLELVDVDLATEDYEKVNTAAVILNEYVLFSTFNPSSEVEEVKITTDDGQEVVLCRRGGNARTYRVHLLNANPPDGEDRYIQHDSDTAMATEPVVYLGADGKIHIIQALDNLELDEPIDAMDIPLRVMSWKEE
jgi:hypothetical protein